jgi:hypothetical protein
MEVRGDHRAALSGDEYTDAVVDACDAIGVDPESFYTAREERGAARTTERVVDGSRGVFADVDALGRLPGRAALGASATTTTPRSRPQPSGSGSTSSSSSAAATSVPRGSAAGSPIHTT